MDSLFGEDALPAHAPKDCRGGGRPDGDHTSQGSAAIMNLKHRLLIAGAFAAASIIATAASAAPEITITTVGVGNGDGQFGTVDISGYGQPWTTPILMTDSTGQTFVVFCDDLEHDVDVAGGQSLPYHFGEVQFDGFGNLLGTMGGGSYSGSQYATAEDISNKMGQIADVGRYDYLGGNLQGADAAQAAIWGLEYAQYGWTVSASDPVVEADLLADLKVSDNGRGWAEGLIADGGTQSQIFGAVPEPATWAMMMLGLFGIGAMMRRRRESLALA